MAQQTPAQIYALMIPRLRHMETDDLEALLRDLEDNDPDGDYSAATQEAAQDELEYRWVLANPQTIIGPHEVVASTAPQRAIVSALDHA